MNEKKILLLAILALSALSFLLYARTLKAPFIFDDFSCVVQNPDVKQLSNLKTRLFYPLKAGLHEDRNDPSRPLAFLTFTLNYALGGKDPFGFHLFNLTLHLLNSILVFLLLKKLLRDSCGETGDFLALAASLFFAAHPAGAEVAAYIAHRTEGLVLLFYLLSILLFTRGGGKVRYALSLLSFALALASKEIAATLPLMLLAVEYLHPGLGFRGRGGRWQFYHAPYWTLLAVYLVLRGLTIGFGTGRLDTALKWTHYSYFLTQIHVVSQYLKMVVLPTGACVDHFIAPVRSALDHRVWSALLYLSAVPVFLGIVKKKEPALFRPALFVVLWILIALAPTSSILPIDDPMADRRLYLPGAGYSLLLALAYLMVVKLLAAGATLNRRCSYAALLLLVHAGLAGAVTWARSAKFSDPAALWTEAIAVYPGNYRAYNNLGKIYADGGDGVRAEELFKKTLQLNPEYYLAHKNLGDIYYYRRDFDKAISAYRSALAASPQYWEPYNNLGAIYVQLGRAKDAGAAFQKALELNPGSAEAANNLGVICLHLKQFDRAAQFFRQAAKADPYYGLPLKNLGDLHFSLKDYNSALEEFEAYSRLTPGDASVQEKIAAIKKLREQGRTR
ncbi:MAG: tetratricopeptide repeat protein [Elusimicrobiales bacterium]|nr:tetratricopeptide repeat protein [Elusimicrobiales bacterium]